MLHILWLILKFILIILGILLGLLLLAVLLVLFCPVRYKASAVKAEGGWKQTEGEGIVSWLFHGISLRAEWKDQQMEISFHLFGIPVDKLLKKRQKKRAVTKKSGKNPEKSGAEKVSVSGIDGNREEEHKKSVVDHPKSENMETEDLKTDRNSASDTSADTERIRNSQISGQQELNADDTDRNSLKKRQFFIKRIYDRIRNIFQLIRTKLQNIRRTFGKIKKNVSWWKAFIEHPRVTAARKLVWKHGKFLLKHIFPTRIEGQVTFSFEDPALTTDLIAGFPGETEEDHEELMNFVDEMEFDRLGVFTYSAEEDTPAATMPDQIPEELKEERRDEIMELQQEISFEKAEEMVGKSLWCMVEGKVADEYAYVARTYKDAPGVDGYLFIQTIEELMSGDFVKVRVTGADEYDLIGEIDDEFTE